MDQASLNIHWDEAPVLFDVISSNGTVLYANTTEAKALGVDAGSLTGKPIDQFYTAPSRAVIRSMFETAERTAGAFRQRGVRLTLRVKGKVKLNVIATLDVVRDDLHGHIMRLAKFEDVADAVLGGDLVSEIEVLTSILEAAQDATYCVEFVDPVDLSAPEHEIIRQVFENACRWRYCNEAMGRFYRLPAGEDLNSRDVREVFYRNPDNEAFVRKLIESGWHVNSATSRDHRYDGADVYVENDVRAHIANGRLYRFWGTLRDQSARILKERQLKTEAGQALDLLGAVPDPILVVNRDGRIEGANPATEWVLNWPLDELLGRRLESVLAFDGNLRQLISAAGPGRDAVRRRATVLRADGGRVDCEIHVASMVSGDPAGKLVITVRTMAESFKTPLAMAGGSR